MGERVRERQRARLTALVMTLWKISRNLFVGTFWRFQPRMQTVTSDSPHSTVSSRQRCPQAKGLESVAPLVRTGEETPDPIPTTVNGTIPTWINGSFLRNGPGKFEFGKDRYTHWFDGMAMMHRFHICDGRVSYCSRFLRSDSFVQNSEKNRIVVSEFGTLAMPDPCKNIFARFFSRFQIPKTTDNASVNFVKYKGDYYVSTETNFMRRIDPQSLETKDKVDWSKFVAVNAATAHPHYDREGASYNMGNSYGKNGYFYTIIRVPPPDDNAAMGDSADLTGTKVVCSIPAAEPRKPSYYHSFVMSENYIVFVEQPIKLDLMKFMLYRIQGKSFHKAMTWEPQCQTIFHLVNRHTGERSKVKYTAAPMFTLHQINAYEDNGFLVMDMCCGDEGQVIAEFTLENLRRESGEEMDKFYNAMCRNLPRRYILPLTVDEKTPADQNLVTLPNCTATAKKTKPGEVLMTHEELHDDQLLQYGGLEFPQINYAQYNGRPYRYFYSCGFGHVFSDSLLKMDVHTKELKVWRHPGLFPSEPVFVASPNATEEDDGVVMSVIITPRKEKSTFLLVLDAKTFTELARAEVPVNIPYGTHGVFNEMG
nr:beta-carotene 15, 15-dioxygenase 2, like isoform X1 [Solea senegalensis]